MKKSGFRHALRISNLSSTDATFKDVDHIERFKAFMNTEDPNMRFTSELEENDVFPFLDIKVIRSGLSFITSVYRKPTFCGV